jgi:hypothetical protein
MLQFLFTLLLFYALFILSFYLFIYSKDKNKKINKIEYISIFKDKEFINFKFNLFNLYYSFTIVFLFFLFKNNYYLNFNFILFFIILYSILLSNVFIIILFNTYKKIIKNLQILNKTNFIFETVLTNKFNYSNNNLYSQTRAFSTDSGFKKHQNIIYKKELDFMEIPESDVVS